MLLPRRVRLDLAAEPSPRRGTRARHHGIQHDAADLRRIGHDHRVHAFRLRRPAPPAPSKAPLPVRVADARHLRPIGAPVAAPGPRGMPAVPRGRDPSARVSGMRAGAHRGGALGPAGRPTHARPRGPRGLPRPTLRQDHGGEAAARLLGLGPPGRDPRRRRGPRSGPAGGAVQDRGGRGVLA